MAVHFDVFCVIVWKEEFEEKNCMQRKTKFGDNVVIHNIFSPGKCFLRRKSFSRRGA
jgi:hypothetical protein